jgi:cytochrome c-type biogenesis protein CcmH
MISFWIAAAALSGGAALLMARAAAQAARVKDAGNPAMSVYQRQLAEFDDLAERGLIGETDLKTARIETRRRMLRAAEASGMTGGRPASPRLITLAAGVTPLIAVGAYLLLGAPGYPDQPFAARLAGWQATARTQPTSLTVAQAIAVLTEQARHNDNDPGRWRSIATLSLEGGDAAGAAQAMRRAVALAPRDAVLRAQLGEALTLTDPQHSNPEADRAFVEALRLQPGLPDARYGMARARIGRGDVAGGLADWRALAASLPADDRRRAALEQEIASVQAWGGLTPPPSAQAPARDMSAAIRGMVSGLAARLRANPDDPQGWIRLVRAYTVLGETQARDAALTQARARYRGRPDVLRGLDEALRPPPR